MPSLSRFLPPGLIALSLFTLAACNAPSSSTPTTPSTSSNPPAAPAAAGPVAPAWTLPDLNGKSVSLSDFKGKVVVLDFWATWCPPCRAEIPHFIEIQNEFANQGVTVVGLSVDSTGPASVAEFAKANGMNYPIVMADEKTATAYGADQGIPTTAVIDANGHIVATHLGLTDKDTFVAEIKQAIANGGVTK